MTCIRQLRRNYKRVTAYPYVVGCKKDFFTEYSCLARFLHILATIRIFSWFAISMPTLLVPRLPVLGWSAMRGGHASTLPAVLDIPNLVWTASGRAAIAFALREMGVGVGDRVLVPTYHCPTMVAPIVAAGAQPLFFPISDTGMPQLERIAGFDLQGVRCMIAAHYFGIPQPMAAVRAFCDTHKIMLIEDCAHAMFGKADGQAIGTWGDYAIASLTKFFPVLDGGCIVSARHAIRNAPARSKSWRDELRNIINVLETAVRYKRLSGINAGLAALFLIKDALRQRKSAVGEPKPSSSIAQPDIVKEGLADFEANSVVWSKPFHGTRWLAMHSNRARMVELRRRNYRRLSEQLSDVAGARPLFPALSDDAAPYVFPLLVDSAERDYQLLRASGVPVFRWDWRWPNTPDVPSDAGARWAMEVFQIGCHQDLSLEDIDAIAETIKTLLRGEDIR